MNAPATTQRKQRATRSKKIDPAKPAAIVINDKFNGLTHFCALTGYATSTAHWWLVEGYIPPKHKGAATYSHILKIAADNKIKMTGLEFVDQPVALAANG